jgi:hypothetical protein
MARMTQENATMARDYTKNQKAIIDRYYEHFDTILLQKLQELVTDLFLAKDTPKEDRLWERVEKALVNLKVPPALRAHILQKRRVEILAANLEDWLKKKKP